MADLIQKFDRPGAEADGRGKATIARRNLERIRLLRARQKEREKAAVQAVARDPSIDAAVVYLNAPQVRSRYGGISEMTLWRWLDD